MDLIIHRQKMFKTKVLNFGHTVTFSGVSGADYPDPDFGLPQVLRDHHQDPGRRSLCRPGRWQGDDKYG